MNATELENAMRANKARLALWHLRQARAALRVAETPRALERVRLAIKSTEGACRHADIRHASQYWRARERAEGGDT